MKLALVGLTSLQHTLKVTRKSNKCASYLYISIRKRERDEKEERERDAFVIRKRC